MDRCEGDAAESNFDISLRRDGLRCCPKTNVDPDVEDATDEGVVSDSTGGNHGLKMFRFDCVTDGLAVHAESAVFKDGGGR
jgi:hypothetical protein